MKKSIIPQALLAILLIFSCCNNLQKKEQDEAKRAKQSVSSDSIAAFETFTEFFSKSAAFAYVEVSGRKVLLVSHETFGPDENHNLEAIEASIFAFDNEMKIVALGSIRSQGTLYPVSILDGKLMVAGHQFVKTYSIRGEIPELVLDDYEEGESQKLTAMFKTFEKGTSIKFERK